MTVFFGIGCGEAHGSAVGDGGAPRAQAAISFTSRPAPGQLCTATNDTFAIPTKDSASVTGELACDPSTGCKPDKYVVVDADKGSTVSCTVSSGEGNNYTAQLNLVVDGSSQGGPSVNFEVSAPLSPAGGMAAINESNSVAPGGGSQVDCSVTITPPSGLLKSGAIWASFECDSFRDPNSIGDTGCVLSGKFLFENCAH